MTHAYDRQKMQRDTESTVQETHSLCSSYRMDSLKHIPLWASLAYGDEVLPSLSIAAKPLQRKSNATDLPDTLKAGIESLSDLTMDDVEVHYHSSQPARVQALAYTQGTDIYVGPEQEQHLPHEAWHVVQQKQGRVQATSQARGFAINDNQGLEKEADIMSKQAEEVGGKILRQSEASSVASASLNPDQTLPPENNASGVQQNSLITKKENLLPNPGTIQMTVGKQLVKGDRVITTRSRRRGTIDSKSRSQPGYYVNVEGYDEPRFYAYDELDEDTGREKREEQPKRRKMEKTSEGSFGKKASKSKEEVPTEFTLNYKDAVEYAAKLPSFSEKKKYIEEWLKINNKPATLYGEMISDVSKEVAKSQSKKTEETEPSGFLAPQFTSLSTAEEEQILAFKDPTEQYRKQVRKNATGKFPYQGQQIKTGNYTFTFGGDSAKRHVEEYVQAEGDRLNELRQGKEIYTAKQLAKDLLGAAAIAVDKGTLGSKGSAGTVQIQGSLSGITWHLIIVPVGHSLYNIAHAHPNEYVTGLED